LRRRLLGAWSPFTRLLACYALALFSSYLAIFWIIGGRSLATSLEAAAVNTIPAFALGFVLRDALQRLVFKRSLSWQLALHPLLAVAYSLILYWIILSTFALLRGQFSVGFIVQPFPDAAGVWQLVHGLNLYALFVALSWIDAAAPRATEEGVRAASSGAEPPARTLLLRRDDEIVPVEVSEIVSITAAGDYAELSMSTGHYLARMSLAELAAQLPGQFVRVHRSHIVNLNLLVRAEPAGGGRMTLHLANGASLPASRSGARLLRERAI